MSNSLRPHGLQPTRLLCPWNFPDKNTGAGCHFLLQGIFPTQVSNLGLPLYRQMLYRLSHQGSPCMLYNVYIKVYMQSSVTLFKDTITCLPNIYFSSFLASIILTLLMWKHPWLIISASTWQSVAHMVCIEFAEWCFWDDPLMGCSCGFQ